MICLGMRNWMYNEYLIVTFYVKEFETECVTNVWWMYNECIMNV